MVQKASKKDSKKKKQSAEIQITKAVLQNHINELFVSVRLHQL
jgi:hypothetical protein